MTPIYLKGKIAFSHTFLMVVALWPKEGLKICRPKQCSEPKNHAAGPIAPVHTVSMFFNYHPEIYILQYQLWDSKNPNIFVILRLWQCFWENLDTQIQAQSLALPRSNACWGRTDWINRMEQINFSNKMDWIDQIHWRSNRSNRLDYGPSINDVSSEV